MVPRLWSPGTSEPKRRQADRDGETNGTPNAAWVVVDMAATAMNANAIRATSCFILSVAERRRRPFRDIACQVENASRRRPQREATNATGAIAILRARVVAVAVPAELAAGWRVTPRILPPLRPARRLGAEALRVAPGSASVSTAAARRRMRPGAERARSPSATRISVAPSTRRTTARLAASLRLASPSTPVTKISSATGSTSRGLGQRERGAVGRGARERGRELGRIEIPSPEGRLTGRPAAGGGDAAHHGWRPPPPAMTPATRRRRADRRDSQE